MLPTEYSSSYCPPVASYSTGKVRPVHHCVICCLQSTAPPTAPPVASYSTGKVRPVHHCVICCLQSTAPPTAPPVVSYSTGKVRPVHHCVRLDIDALMEEYKLILSRKGNTGCITTTCKRARHRTRQSLRRRKHITDLKIVFNRHLRPIVISELRKQNVSRAMNELVHCHH